MGYEPTTSLRAHPCSSTCGQFARIPRIGMMPTTEEFKLEQFEEEENSNMDYKGTNCEFMSFRSGCRTCPSANLELANNELTLDSLLYHFY
jgi:cytochrome P450